MNFAATSFMIDVYFQKEKCLKIENNRILDSLSTCHCVSLPSAKAGYLQVCCLGKAK